MKSLIGELNFATSPGHGDVHVKNIIFNENTGMVSHKPSAEVSKHFRQKYTGFNTSRLSNALMCH